MERKLSVDGRLGGDVDDANDVTLPTFGRRKTCAEVSCRFPMEPVGL